MTFTDAETGAMATDALEHLGSTAVAELDRYLRFVKVWGRRFLASLDLDVDDFEGKHLFQIVSPHNRPAAARVYSSALDGAPASEIMSRNRRILVVRVEPLRYTDGSVRGCVALWSEITDVTDLRVSLLPAEPRRG